MEPTDPPFRPPDDARSLEARIHDAYPDLSTAERRMADILLLHQMDLPLYTAAELAREAGVSTATAARLFRELGYESYPEAKRRIREENHWGSPQAGLVDSRQSISGSGTPAVAPLLQATLNNIRSTMESLPTDELDRWRDTICEARTLWIIGLRNGYGIAHVAGHYFSLVKSGVRVLPGTGTSLAADLSSVGAGDAVLVVAFRRRPRMLAGMLRELERAGASTMLLTDVSALESARAAQRVIRCRCRVPSPFNSFAAALPIIDYLAWAVAYQLGEDSAERFRRIDRMVTLFDDVSTPVRS
ncbi:MurR/RpiR family transcriptional regulator [Celeribacter indicus]|uniref:RpiR family transcriptional regulator n=1 Tax=Celeribacter indicus TaxID=1208324 RepID=A0A0B5E0B2_9RHOB|nr:MurR/RpiR family transcriptional regulator [Celeribacter indicus]AJE48659.1 RpiR family transcriptional regulator [Celeribacter indicus]SDX35116.1 transcriptional regulator, RpiR family [Celeribacter indicus]